jgi:hypothetical protein
MSHLALFKHETQVIKNPPPTFQTVSRRGVLRSSPFRRSQKFASALPRLVRVLTLSDAYSACFVESCCCEGATFSW